MRNARDSTTVTRMDTGRATNVVPILDIQAADVPEIERADVDGQERGGRHGCREHANQEDGASVCPILRILLPKKMNAMKMPTRMFRNVSHNNPSP